MTARGACCRHRRVFARIWVPGDVEHSGWIKLLGDGRNVHARVCADCREWLPLGKATDTGEHAASVAVELRAAEIAQEIADVTARRSRNKTLEGRDVCYRHLSMDGAEHAGHLTMMSNSAKVPEQDGEWSGYLAAYIAHGDEP